MLSCKQCEARLPRFDSSWVSACEEGHVEKGLWESDDERLLGMLHLDHARAVMESYNTELGFQH